MHCYVLTHSLSLKMRTQWISITHATNPDHPAANEVYIAAQNELDVVRSALKRTYPAISIDALLYCYDTRPISLLLGARRFVDANCTVPPNCLISQLQALKSSSFERHHYRLIVINGFGTNLGDNLIGLSAFSHALVLIRSILPEVSVDVMLGWHEDDRLERLYRDVEGIDRILTRGISLSELAGYQGIFDFSDLLILPKYATMPIVDWYLWWMGIDPETVQKEEKRNRIFIPESARELASLYLEEVKEERWIVINPKASIPLRCIPESAVRGLIAYLLEVRPDIGIVLVQPLHYEDPRVYDLSSRITNIDILAAIIAKCDALIGADTYTQHLCDATSTPAVTLYTSILPDLYPYYPLVEAVMLPSAQELPGWGKMKISSEVWENSTYLYDLAWMILEPELIFLALERAIDRKK